MCLHPPQKKDIKEKMPFINSDFAILFRGLQLSYLQGLSYGKEWKLMVQLFFKRKEQNVCRKK